MLLGIDIGTSACKAAVFDESGCVVAQTNVSYEVRHPHPGWAEQEPENWWEAVCCAVRSLLADGCVNPENIEGVGVDGQSWAAVAIDGQGQVLCPTPIWMDTRARDICEQWHRTGGQTYFELCGNPIQPGYTTPKVAWYRDNRPEVYRRADKILQCNSYIVYRLTDTVSQDLSQGYGWHCFDMRHGTWDTGRCRDLGIRSDLLPPLAACHEVVGRVTEKAAVLTGLLPGTPVVAGGLDAACGTLGAGVVRPGQAQEQGGQAGGMSLCIDEYRADPRLILSAHVVPGQWLLQGGTTGGGGVMRWLERELGESERLRAVETGTSSMVLLDQAAASVVPGSDGLIFLPYMAGERSPIWNPSAKGVFYGLDFRKTKAHMIRAALEGVAYSLRHNLEVAREAGADTDCLHTMGGAANSRLWTQMKADITGKRIRVPGSDTATTLGAALLAGVGVGIYSSFEEAVERSVCFRKEYEPDQSKQAVYDAGYATYRELYEHLKCLMTERRNDT